MRATSAPKNSPPDIRGALHFDAAELIVKQFGKFARRADARRAHSPNTESLTAISRGKGPLRRDAEKGRGINDISNVCVALTATGARTEIERDALKRYTRAKDFGDSATRELIVSYHPRIITFRVTTTNGLPRARTNEIFATAAHHVKFT